VLVFGVSRFADDTGTVTPPTLAGRVASCFGAVLAPPGLCNKLEGAPSGSFVDENFAQKA